MGGPYRHNDAEKPAEPKSGELVYRPTERSDRNAGGRSGFKLFALPCILGLVVGALLGQWAGIGAAAALFGFLWWWGKKHPENVVVAAMLIQHDPNVVLRELTFLLTPRNWAGGSVT